MVPIIVTVVVLMEPAMTTEKRRRTVDEINAANRSAMRSMNGLQQAAYRQRLNEPSFLPSWKIEEREEFEASPPDWVRVCEHCGTNRALFDLSNPKQRRYLEVTCAECSHWFEVWIKVYGSIHDTYRRYPHRRRGEEVVFSVQPESSPYYRDVRRRGAECE